MILIDIRKIYVSPCIRSLIKECTNKKKSNRYTDLSAGKCVSQIILNFKKSNVFDFYDTFFAIFFQGNISVCWKLMTLYFYRLSTMTAVDEEEGKEERRDLLSSQK